MAGHAGLGGVGDHVDRVGGPRVLGQRVIVQVEYPRIGVDHHVLEHRAELPRRGVDLRLCLLGQADHLGVTAALEIEHAAVAPPVLVVSDQRALGVGGQRRLAGARQAEEHGRVAVRPHVGGAVHRQHVGLREQVVHHGEDRLLDLARVARAADQHHPAAEIEDDEYRGVRAVDLGVRVKAGALNDRELWFVVADRIQRRAEEHVSREHAVPCVLRHDPDRNPVLGIGTGPQVLHEDSAPLQVGAHAAVQVLEFLGRERPILGAPPDLRLRARFLHDELVQRRAAGVVSRAYHERAAGEDGLVRPDRVLVQRGSRVIPPHDARADDAVILYAVTGNDRSDLLHAVLVRCPLPFMLRRIQLSWP